MDHVKIWVHSHLLMAKIHFPHLPHLCPLPQGSQYRGLQSSLSHSKLPHCNIIFKTTLEVQALLQYLYDMFQLVRKWITRTVQNETKQPIGHMQASSPRDKLWLWSFLKILNVKSLYKNLKTEITIWEIFLHNNFICRKI